MNEALEGKATEKRTDEKSSTAMAPNDGRVEEQVN